VERFISLALICGAVAVVMVWFFLIRAHHHPETTVELVPVQPRSVVHVLRTQDELEQAVRRVANFERRANAGRQLRADRYDALITPSPIVHILSELGEECPDDQVISA
jgi:hypothetical protein